MILNKAFSISNLLRKGMNVNISQKMLDHTSKKYGKREVVGHGWNGMYNYFDKVSFPMPGLRFKEPSKESECLQAKEKLDWRKLSMAEKRALYRYSFCQTFSELKAGTGQWKMHLGFLFMAISLGIWVYINHKLTLYVGQLPVTFDEEHQKAQLKRMLMLDTNPITGISSKWDYEKKRWK